MTWRYTTEIRNAGLDAQIAAVGPDATLRIYGADGRELVAIPLGSDWMAPAKDGAVTSMRPWGAYATADGEAKSFSICNAAGAACISGSIPEDLKLANRHIPTCAPVMISPLTIVSAND